MTNQVKKHNDHITNEEREYLFERVANTWATQTHLRISNHLQEALKDGSREFNVSVAKDTLMKLKACLVEYNCKFDAYGNRHSERVLLRSERVIKDKRGKYSQLVFSIGLDDLTIVTAWLNHVNDNHKTLNDSIYTNSLKIIK